MPAQFICHPDFAGVTPRNVFHKEIPKIKLPEHDERLQNRHILFRRQAILPEFRKAVLRVSADDYYKLFLNGRPAAQGPASGYPQAYYYNEIDVTAFLRPGKNTFAAHTYYQGLINRVWVSGDLRESFWFSLSLDGKEFLVSDQNWKCADHTAYSSCGRIGYDTAFAEVYDSRAPEIGFEAEDFDDRAWQSAAILSSPDYTLIPQPTKQLEWETLLPKTTERIPGGLRIDFGREAVGSLSAVAKGKSGDRVRILCGEELCEDGSVRFDMRANCRYEEGWILSGGNDTLDQYDYKAFRYAEFLFPDTVELSDVRFLVRHYPYTEKATYSGVREDLRPILRLCADTVRYGMQENFVDCPTREKGQYLGDVSIAGRSHAVLTGDTTMMKKAIREFCVSSFICPGIMTISGCSVMQEIADYSLQFPAQVLWIYRRDGDLEFLRETEPYLTGAYRYFLGYTNPDGLIENVTEKWNLVDWPQNLRDDYDYPLIKPIGPGVHNVLNAFWCGFLEAMDGVYAALGMEPTGMTEKVKASFLRTFYCEETGLFRDAPGTTHAAIQSNVLPLLFDIGTEDAALRERLIRYLEKRKLTCMGVYMAYFALAALVRHGERKLAEELAADPGCWALMLREGATTTFEAWGKDQKWNTSLFHPWATAPLIVFADGTDPY